MTQQLRKPQIRQPHIEYAIIRKFIQDAKYTQIVEELANQEIADKYGFKRIEVQYDWFVRKINRVKETVKDAIKKAWAEGITGEPLTDARYCLHRLHQIESDPLTSPQNVILAIKEARNIVGFTDADKKALEKSGKTEISIAEKLLIKWDKDAEKAEKDKDNEPN